MGDALTTHAPRSSKLHFHGQSAELRAAAAIPMVEVRLALARMTSIVATSNPGGKTVFLVRSPAEDFLIAVFVNRVCLWSTPDGPIPALDVRSQPASLVLCPHLLFQRVPPDTDSLQCSAATDLACFVQSSPTPDAVSAQHVVVT